MYHCGQTRLPSGSGPRNNASIPRRDWQCRRVPWPVISTPRFLVRPAGARIETNSPTAVAAWILLAFETASFLDCLLRSIPGVCAFDQQNVGGVA